MSAVALLALVGGWFFYSDAFGLRSNVLPKPTPLTELYFEDHLLLPEVVPDDKLLPFSFTIHNLEYEPRTYTLTVSVDDANQATSSVTLLQDQVQLDHNQQETVSLVADFRSFPGPWTTVTVKLQEPAECIYFRVASQAGLLR